MGIFDSQSHFDFLHRLQKNFSFKSTLNIKSPFIFCIIVVIHLLFIFIALTSKSSRKEDLSHESLLQVIMLRPQKPEFEFEPHVPEVNIRSYALQLEFHIPDVKYAEADISDLDLSAIEPNVHYELPNINADKFKDVFDPRLRKQLQENHQVVSKAKIAKMRTWNDGAGNTVAEVGEGDCIRSMPAVGGALASQGTTWSMVHFKCGKDESDRMMDNINADLEARKHPLSQ